MLLTVHDVRGRRIRVLLEGDLPCGTMQVFDWDGTDDAGRAMSTGVYFARAMMGDASSSVKMLLVK